VPEKWIEVVLKKGMNEFLALAQTELLVVGWSRRLIWCSSETGSSCCCWSGECGWFFVLKLECSLVVSELRLIHVHLGLDAMMEQASYK
jgi:hypothetical protein